MRHHGKYEQYINIDMEKPSEMSTMFGLEKAHGPRHRDVTLRHEGLRGLGKESHSNRMRHQAW